MFARLTHILKNAHTAIDWPLEKEEEQEKENFFKCVSNSCDRDGSELSKYEAKKQTHTQRSTNRYEDKQNQRNDL